ncbi:MAG: methyltransferase domain-containing protein [Candidatus Aenigmarchaeota archaeon]|nr:methyltransferase domain-containing protein [Candidatus Aenigmarchaeota archaeon]
MMVFLVGKRRVLVNTSAKSVNTDFGRIDLAKIKKYGQAVKSSTGDSFVALKPSFVDLLKKAKRGPQVVTPKDAAQIVALTGAESGWNCLDAGGGSGFLSLFIANIVKPGTVTAYERTKESAEKIKSNAKLFGLGNIVVKNKDVLRGFSEKKLDLITLDMIGAEKMIKPCHRALKEGGWLAVYSPHIEQQLRCIKELDKLKMECATVENTRRFWKSKAGFTHPFHTQLAHTGFITVARKI